MKRELEQLARYHSDCCPGHDDYPNDTYRNKRSKRARAKGKIREHKYVRTLQKRGIRMIIQDKRLC